MKKFKRWILETPNLQNIVSVSGGKDSTATYLRAIQMGVPFRAVMADTGNEHPITLETVENLPKVTGGPAVEIIKADFTKDFERKRKYITEKWPDKGVPPHVVERALGALHPTGNPFLDLCMIKGRFPSSKAQFCTEELKAHPINMRVIFPALKNGPVLQWHGVRGTESARRARLPRVQRDDTGAVIWRPIYFYTVNDVFALHRKFGVPPNPLYTMGMGRVGCMPCINCAKDELANIATRFAEHIDKVRSWEALVSNVCRRGSATFFPSNVDPLASCDDEISHTTHGIDRAVAWSKTSRGGTQYDIFSQGEPPMCSSKYGLCE